MKILIVDDETISREILRKILATNKEHQVTVAQNGTEAWALLEDSTRYFDVVFLDITMPEPDGLEILRRIRQAPLLRTLYVVMCTAAADRPTVSKAIELGAQNYLVKPCTEATVLAKLKQIQPAIEEASLHRLKESAVRRIS